MVYTITGPFFFGAAAQVAHVLDQIEKAPSTYVLDLSAVPLADESAAQTLLTFVAKAKKTNSRVMVAGARRDVRRLLLKAGLNRSVVVYVSDTLAARARHIQRQTLARSP